MTSPNRMALALIVGLLVACTATQVGAQQFPSDQQVFPPGDLSDMQPFAPGDASFYDGPPAPKRGFFLSIDGLLWSISKPELSYIGQAPPASRLVFTAANNTRPTPNAITTGDTFYTQTSEMNTTAMNNGFESGGRVEGGYMGRFHGVTATYYGIHRQDQYLEESNAAVVFTDPLAPADGLPVVNTNHNVGYLWGQIGTGALMPFPITYNTLQAVNRTDHWNFELLYTRRFQQFPNGGVLDMYLGGRYMELNENFNVTGIDVVGYDGALGPTGNYDDAWWNTEVHNHIFGPEIGARYSQNRGRWGMSFDGRFTAGINNQSYRQAGELFATNGSTTTPLFLFYGNEGFTHFATENTFAPVVELRAEVRYQLTKAFALKAGWNGIWMDGIGRASSSVLYQVPDLGIDTSRNRQDVFVTGVNVGMEFNR